MNINFICSEEIVWSKEIYVLVLIPLPSHSLFKRWYNCIKTSFRMIFCEKYGLPMRNVTRWIRSSEIIGRSGLPLEQDHQAVSLTTKLWDLATMRAC